MNPSISPGAASSRLGRLVLAALTALGALSAAGPASARIYGTFRVNSGTQPVKEDIYGAVLFDSNNATLDCTGHQIHISSSTRALCNVPGVGVQKCAVTASGKSNIKIQNCNIVGGFNQGVFLDNSDTVDIVNVTSAGVLDTGMWLQSSSNVNFGADSVILSETGYYFMGSRNVSIKGAYSGANTHGFYQDGGNVGYWWSAIAEDNYVGFWGKHLGARYGWLQTKYGSNAPYGERVRAQGNTYEGLFLEGSDDVLVNYVKVLENNQANHLAAGGLVLSDVDNSKITGNEALDNNVCDLKADATSTGNTWTLNTSWSRCGNVP